MIDKLIEIDQEIFLYLNGNHLPWLDSPFFIFTHTLTWTPLFLVLLYLIVKDYRKKSWIFLIGLTIAIAFADQFTSTIMKPYFERLRPTHEPALTGLVHTVKNYVGGKYGFASSHAANTFATATFLFILLGQKRPWTWALFVWATFICYTRIYLGVHYPGDLLAGGLIGCLAGWGMAKLSLYASRKVPSGDDVKPDSYGA